MSEHEEDEAIRKFLRGLGGGAAAPTFDEDEAIQNFISQQQTPTPTGADGVKTPAERFLPSPGPTFAQGLAEEINLGVRPEQRSVGERLKAQFLPRVDPDALPGFIPGPLRGLTADALETYEQLIGVPTKVAATIVTDPTTQQVTEESFFGKLAERLEAQERKPASQRAVEEGILDPLNFLGLGLGRSALRALGAVSLTGRQQAAGLGRLAAEEATEKARQSIQELIDAAGRGGDPQLVRPPSQIALPPGQARTPEGAIIGTGQAAPPGQRLREGGLAQPLTERPPSSVGEVAAPLQVAPPRGRILEASTPEEAARLRAQIREQPGVRTPMADPAEIVVQTLPSADINILANTVAARQQVKESVTKEFFDAVPDSPTDIAATAYLRTGKIGSFIDNIPEIFEVAKDFGEEVFREVGRVGAKFADPTRTIQAIDFGYFGGGLQRGLLWPTRRTFIASLNWGDTNKIGYRKILDKHGIRGINPIRTRQKLDAAGDVLEQIGSNEVFVSDDVLVAQVDNLLKKFSPEEKLQIVRVAKDTRVFFDDLLDIQNAARAKRGQSEIPKQQNYRPWVRNTSLWARTGNATLPSREIAQSPIPPDFIKPNEAFNPRAAARVGGLEGYEKVRNIEKLATDYVETARKDIFYTNIIQNGKAHIKELRRRGIENSAAAVEDWIMEAYAGKRTRGTAFIRETFPPIAVKGALALRRSLARSVFPLNWTWSALVQTSSGALTLKNYGLRNTLHGFEYLVNPRIRKEVSSNAYSAIIKRRNAGRASSQDLGVGVESTQAVQRSAVETAEGWANFMSNLVEDNLTGMAVRAAYHDGRSKGFTGRALWEYASEGGSKTQSMYNMEDLPGVLRTPEIGALAPFQTFAFEIFNTVRELGIGVGRIGTDKVHGNRMVALAQWFAAMTAFNIVGEKVNNRQPWQLSSFVPFWGLITGGVNAGSPFGDPLPIRYSADLWDGIMDVYTHNNWKDLRSWAIKYHMLGGTQINRTLEGIEAVSKGGVFDVAGRKKFDVTPDEWLKAVSQGPYSTSDGREYIDKLNESKGPIFKHTGIPIRQRPATRPPSRSAPFRRGN